MVEHCRLWPPVYVQHCHRSPAADLMHCCGASGLAWAMALWLLPYGGVNEGWSVRVRRRKLRLVLEPMTVTTSMDVVILHGGIVKAIPAPLGFHRVKT
jgi:hypothetical protein